MYFYIYDSLLVKKKYDKTVSRIEIRLASLDIAGRKHKLSVLRSVREVTRKIFEQDVSPTVVVVGGDKIFYDTVLALAGTEATVGFIPVKSDSLVADILGIPINEYACDVISARRIEYINLGKINNQYFFSSIEFEPKQSPILVDGKYQIIPRKIKLVKVVNLDFLRFQRGIKGGAEKKIVSNPKDNYLEVLMGTPQRKLLFLGQKEKMDSLFFVQKLSIDSKNPKNEILIKVDYKNIVKAPALIEVARENLRIIVGKDRLI